jgi:putative peptidoglycan lipid II flippase
VAIQLPALVNIGMLPRISWNLRESVGNAGVRRVIKQMVPATFAVSVAQISLIINTNIASHLQDGSVSWLSYADRLMELPTGLLGVALGTVLLPSLSKAHADGDTAEYSALLDWGLRLTFMMALPAAVALAVLSEPITTTLFHYGKFDTLSVAMTAKALIAYGVGLIGLILVKILAPGFYAKQDIKTPVKIAIVVLFLTQAMNALFVPWIAHAGLALSIGLGACINAAFLYRGLKRRGIYSPRSGWGMFIVKLCAALALLAGFAYWGASHFHWVNMQATPFLRMGILLTIIGICMIIYFGALLAMGFRLKDFKRISA